MESKIVRAFASFFEARDLPKFRLTPACRKIPGSAWCGAPKITPMH